MQGSVLQHRVEDAAHDRADDAGGAVGGQQAPPLHRRQEGRMRRRHLVHRPCTRKRLQTPRRQPGSARMLVHPLIKPGMTFVLKIPLGAAASSGV